MIMKTRNYMGLGVLVAGLMMSTVATMAQGAGGRGGGGGGNFDPEQMRARMAERMKEQMRATDEEWKVIQPLLEDVQAKQRDVAMGRMGGMMGREEAVLQWLADGVWLECLHVAGERGAGTSFVGAVSGPGCSRRSCCRLRQVNGTWRWRSAGCLRRPGWTVCGRLIDLELQPVLAPREAVQREIKKHLGVGADT
jgi:hypothetical protein